MTSYRLRTLGDLSLRNEAGEELVGPSKGVALLAFLAATPGHAARRSYVADLLWPEGPRSRARASLRQAIYYVGRRVEEDPLQADGERLILRTDRLSVDLWELERAVAEQRWGAVDRLRRGPFVPEVPGEVSQEFRDWVLSVRRRVDGYGDRSAARSASLASSRDGTPAAAGEAGAAGHATKYAAGYAAGHAARHRSRSREIPVPDRHHWITLAAPAAATATGVLLAAAAAGVV
jgi:hypothetical protein